MLANLSNVASRTKADLPDRKMALPFAAHSAGRMTIPLLGAVILAVVSAAGPAAAADPQSIVEALKTVAGSPPKMRATFARGQCVRGTYTPSVEAAQVTRSLSLTRPWPIIGRFSVGGGNPAAPDTTRTVLRGFALKILSDGGETHLLFENAPIHFAKTLDQMFGFLKVRAPGSDGKPDPEAIKAFMAANPETTRQGAFIASKPLPGSYAGIVYWGVHTFTGMTAGGKLVPFKFKVVPEAGEIFLNDDEAKSKPAHFLVADLADRIKKGPAKFDILALLATPDDQTMDITLRWPDEDSRTSVRLGTVAVTDLEPDETCDAVIFDPGKLADGIGAPKDELFAARHEAYGISLRLRSK